VESPVPSHFFYIWSGASFPYLNLVAVQSLLRVEPEARVTVYIVGDKPQSLFFQDLCALSRVEVAQVSPASVFAQLPVELHHVGSVYEQIPSSSASARSNILRYALLYIHGGVYLDFDTVILRSMQDLSLHQTYIGEEVVWAGDESRVAGKWWICLSPRNLFWLASWLLRRADSAWFSGHLRLSAVLKGTHRIWAKTQPNNAVMGSVAAAPFIRELLLACLSADTSVRYSTGPTLVSHLSEKFPHLVTVLPSGCFYAVAPGESFRFFADRTLELPTSTYLVHYAASNHKKLIPDIDQHCRWTRSRGTVMAKLIHSIGSAVEVSGSEVVDKPLVSCLMVTANRIDRARVAIKCFAEQTWPNKELVIIDDGVEDYAPMIAEFDCSHQVRYIKLPESPRLSLGELRNVSIDESRGNWCAQWDDDEWYHPERLEVQLQAALQSNVGACALQWTLMHVEDADRQSFTFRGDSGIATPGTLLFQKSSERYQHLARNEDGLFMRDVRESHGLVVLGKSHSHIFMRVFHGSNTWEKDHFFARLHRRVIDWPSWVWSKWIMRDITLHKAFRLNENEQKSLLQFESFSMYSNELMSL